MPAPVSKRENAILDCKHANEPEKRFDVVVLGNQVAELLAWVDRFPGAGDGIRTTRILWTGGGMGGNLAHAVARLGGRVALISALGDDHLSALQLQQLKQAGVNVDYVFIRPNTPSPTTVLMINPGLERAGLVIDIASGKEVQPAEIPDDLLQSGRVFFTDMVPAEAAVEAAKRSKRLGVSVAYDMQMAAEHVNMPQYNDYIASLYQLCDIFFSDAENFCLWRKTKSLEAAITAVQTERPDLILVITQGAEGSLIVGEGQRIPIPAFKVPVVDTIGAGDAYHGAFLYARFRLNWGLKSAGVFASAVAALSCGAAGAREALPNMTQVLSFLSERRIVLDESKDL